jgi:cytochrome c553
MQGLMKALKPDEKAGVALFFSEQKVQYKRAVGSDLINKGRSYYERLCFRCHGNEKIARIAGQQAPYLTLSLKRYRDGTGERLDPLMSANTKLMTDADVEAVVAYVTSMP